MSSHPSTPAWQGTWLWKVLEERVAQKCTHVAEFVPTLTLWMRKLDTVLRSGGTVPLDFTLHDAEHALRVAHRMEELIPETIREKLSDYELALLLLAAYGHDIGMTPERGKVAAHYRHVFAPDQSTLDPQEVERFQKFLDEHSGLAASLPLTSSIADLNLADELAAYYVRDRHNEWSAEWLRGNLVNDPDDGFGQLPNIVEVLVTLCSSHHWDFVALADSRFDPFTVGSGRDAQVVHLRYLACILRLADILENDPGRTPEVLFRHRGIAERGKSLVHWQKDHDLSITLNGDQLYFQARPRNARVHRALVQLADWIDHELHGIAAFGERLPSEFRGTKRRWHLTSALIRDIRPFDGSYEYIDGAFRPDTARLLQLLSGEQLYGNPLHAVRELLQNAFDAVREKIARKRLDLLDPGDRKWEEILGNQEQVTLTLRPDPNGGWLLVCEDSGVGLNKELITNHVLVSGTGRRHAIRQLERDCGEKGFRPGLTGQFGIGVLSYFMFADEVTLETTRYQGCEGRSESWHFTTRGVGSFGELRRLDKGFPIGGTRVTWGLRRDLVVNADGFEKRLRAYLRHTLIRVPCSFTFNGQNTSWACLTGWTKSETDWNLEMKNNLGRNSRLDIRLRHDDGDYVSERRESERRQEQDEAVRRDQQLQAARESLFCEVKEVELRNGLGFARLVVAFHDLQQGRSLTAQPEELKKPDFPIHHRVTLAWKGILARLNRADEPEWKIEPFPHVSVEIDLFHADASTISVSREGISVLPETIRELREHLQAAAGLWLQEVLNRDGSTFYNEVNLSQQERPLELRDDCCWFHWDAGLPFRPLRRPLALQISRLGLEYKTDHGFSGRLLDSDGQPVASIVAGGELAEIQPGFGIKFLAQEGEATQKPCLYWPREGYEGKSFQARFPEEWRDVGLFRVLDRKFTLLAKDTNFSLLNRDHPLIGLLSDDERARVCRLGRTWSAVWGEVDAAQCASEAVVALCRLACEFIGVGYVQVPDGWEIYRSRRADHLMSLWKMISAATGRPLVDLRLIATNGKGEVLLSPSEVVAPTVTELRPSLLPHVTDPDFLLHELIEPA